MIEATSAARVSTGLTLLLPIAQPILMMAFMPASQ